MQARETLFIKPEKKVEDYLTYLAVQANVAASTPLPYRVGQSFMIALGTIWQ